MWQRMPHRPDQVALSELTAYYEWNGLKWYFRFLGKTEQVVECGGK